MGNYKKRWERKNGRKTRTVSLGPIHASQLGSAKRGGGKTILPRVVCDSCSTGVAMAAIGTALRLNSLNCGQFVSFDTAVARTQLWYICLPNFN